MNEDFIIQLEIADKKYRLRCKRKEEIIFRKAAKLVNDKLNQYRALFTDSKLDAKDLLAMVACQLTVDHYRSEEKVSVTPLFDKLEEMSSELDAYIRSNV